MDQTSPDTVAIVDDDAAVRDSLRFLLEAAGHRVETFAAAAAFLQAESRHIACLVLDQHMPAMTGLDLVARLREAEAALPILLVTGAPSPKIRTRAAELGITWLAEKPLAAGVVLAFVTAATTAC